ncbi:type VI secretion protein Vgr [Chania multitudinisentens RB-25]|uniref:Type VI secretion protein Vgr n=1 Tax=Chania multitudinisentens RB-25 TaxID=1441930 RepID=W0LKM4_9GAMM|nr:type VI secretion system tip protein VgrG [Chania multitudinisentens]AHG22535.1 type VI secretion protein Vgr [Chania multitudinisentens RB-25]
MFADSKKVQTKEFSEASAISTDTTTLSAASKAPSGLQFTLTAAGLPPQTFVVVDFSFNEALSTPFVLHVGLASANPAVDFSAVLDQDSTLYIWREGVLQRSITGMVASFEQGNTGFHQTRYSMVIRPALWRTSLRQNSRIFQLESIESIISTLLKENGINDFAFGFRHPHPAREFCVQYNETDFDFIQRLTAEEGIFYYFEFGSGRNTVVYADDVGALPKGASLPYNPNVAAQAQELCVTHFTRSAQVRPASVQLKDYTFKNPKWAAEFNEQARELQNQRPDYEHFDFPGRFKDEQHGKDFTHYRLEALRNDANMGQGESNEFTLQPGQLFSLNNHPRTDLNHAWQIVSIQHTGKQMQALEQTSGDQGTVLFNHFSFIPPRQTWRPTPLPKPVMDGPQIATVVGPASEEIFCDEYGRVRLQFLWDRYGKSNDQSSCWIRVTQPWAGQGWGMLAIPRIGQEVVVDFLHGDPDQPIVTGRTYHASNLPPSALPGAKTQMALQSKTHKGAGYNELRFEDQEGKQQLSLRAQKDMNTTVLNDRTTTVSGNHTETVTKDQKVTVSGAQTMDITKDQTMTITGAQRINVTQDRIIEVQAGQQTAIKADDRLLISGKQKTKIDLDQEYDVAGSQKNTVGVNQTLKIAGYQRSKIGGDKKTYIGNDNSTRVKGNNKLTVDDSITITAGTSLILQCGLSSIVMDSEGNITIIGVNISSAAESTHNIKGKAVSCCAAMENIMEGSIVKLNP